MTHSPGTDRHPALVSVVAVSLAAMVLSGCASASEPGAGGATPTSPASNGPTGAASVEPTTDAVVVRLRVEDGKVTPVTHRVKVGNGQSVRLVVTADVADEVHVHGYDRHIDVEPGVAAAEEFVADQSGVFEVELEDAEIQLVQLEVR